MPALLRRMKLTSKEYEGMLLAEDVINLKIIQKIGSGDPEDDCVLLKEVIHFLLSV